MLVEVRVRTASEDDAILIPNGSSLPVKESYSRGWKVTGGKGEEGWGE